MTSLVGIVRWGVSVSWEDWDVQTYLCLGVEGNGREGIGQFARQDGMIHYMNLIGARHLLISAQPDGPTWVCIHIPIIAVPF